jgi:hypothetical protein
MDFCFLGNERLLIVSDNLKLYSIEDMSQAPQLLACFLFPTSMTGVHCVHPMDDIIPGPRQRIQAQSAMWTSDPENRLLCLVTFSLDLVFIISTRNFFDLDLFEGVTKAIPWMKWGPSHTRVFRYDGQCGVGISGNRVVQLFLDGTTEDGANGSTYSLHMMDFSRSAVVRRQDVGRVVTEPSTIKVYVEEVTEEATVVLMLTTSLPYVEVVSDRKFGFDDLVKIWIQQDRIYLLKDKVEEGIVGSPFFQEVQQTDSYKDRCH